MPPKAVPTGKAPVVRGGAAAKGTAAAKQSLEDEESQCTDSPSPSGCSPPPSPPPPSQRTQPSSTVAPKKTTPTGGAGSKRPPGAAAAAGRRPGGPPAARGRGAPTGKGGKAPSSQVAKGEVAAPKKPVWSREDGMARKIQTCFRAYRCKKLLLELKRKKADYDQLMEKLQREAYVQMAKLERERAEREREKEEEERRKRREHTQRVKRILEAAFDGDTGEIRAVLNEVASLYAGGADAAVARNQFRLVECTDPNKNTPLSEAGAGGDPDTIRLLIGLGANPNAIGQYGRTPLYRAAFAGHLDAVKVLLESGADPRIYAEDGAVPEQVAAQPAVEEYLKGWDTGETERLLVKLGEAREKRVAEEKQLMQREEDKIQVEIKEAEKDNAARQKQLSKAYEELNKRIYEHDKCVAEGSVKPEITLEAIHDAEEFLAESKILADSAKERLQQAKLKLRLKRKEYQDEEEEGEEERADVVISIRELDDVLMKDVGDKIANSGKWPLIIDPSQQVSTFLRYRDTNFINACNPRHMEAETIRMALLGAIRYGKFMVVDLLDLEAIWRGVFQRFEMVQKSLLPDIMSKTLLHNEGYLSLIRPSDGEEYSPKMFLGARTHTFKFVILTQLFSPPEELLEQCYVIRIHVPQPLGL